VFACKTYNRLKIVKPLDIKNLSSEIEILEHLDHPSIIMLYEKYNQTRNIHLIMELGGDQNLKDFLKSRKEGWVTVEGRLLSLRDEKVVSQNHRRSLVPPQKRHCS